MNLSSFPRLRLAHLPTPLEPLERLSKHLGGPHIWVKRDDCTGLATGGNKTRKLEFLMADAEREGADVVLTQGAIQSNHARQTAAAAARLGVACHILLEERLSDAPAAYQASGNVFLDELCGATIGRHPGGTDMNAALEQAADGLRAAGCRPYVIPGGGSNRIGALGYVDCLSETFEQADAAGIRFTQLWTATGSAGTQAGLLAGMSALEREVAIRGVSVRFDRATQEEKVFALACETARYIDAPPPPRGAVVAYDEYVGAGYGHPTAGMREAVELLARTEGLLLDPVYSGKGMAGLVDRIRRGEFTGDEHIVFLHTGGSASLFAYEWAFERSAH